MKSHEQDAEAKAQRLPQEGGRGVPARRRRDLPLPVGDYALGSDPGCLAPSRAGAGQRLILAQQALGQATMAGAAPDGSTPVSRCIKPDPAAVCRHDDGTSGVDALALLLMAAPSRTVNQRRFYRRMGPGGWHVGQEACGSPKAGASETILP